MTDCDRARDVLEESRRGELGEEASRAVEAHLAECAPCRHLREEADAFAAMMRVLPRTPAPPELRRRILEPEGEARGGWRERRARLSRPLVAAAFSALVVAAALSPWLRLPADAVESLVDAGAREHRRISLQLAGWGSEVADATAALEVLRSLTELPVSAALAGTDDLRLVAARPTMIGDRKAAAAALSDRARSVTTYFTLSGKDLPMPRTHRVRIDGYRPYMRRVNGLQVIYWKQGDLAYLMVTDLDDQQSRRLFLKMRKAL
jgi:anti-sigma factor RsiW